MIISNERILLKWTNIKDLKKYVLSLLVESSKFSSHIFYNAIVGEWVDDISCFLVKLD